MPETRRISLDPGFGSFKAAAISDGRPAVAVVTSVVGVGQTDLGLLSLGRVGRHRPREKPYTVTFDGVDYLVGPGVAQYAQPVERMDMRRLADGPELRAILYATLHQLLGPGEVQVALLSGLPVEVLADRKVALQTLRGLRSWLIGSHVFAVDGQETAITITAVEAMGQPVGSYFAWGLNNAGHWARANGDLRVPVGICDIGFNTVDLLSVQGGQILGRFTGGDTLGVRRAAELLIQGVQGQHGRKLSLHEADALLRQRKPHLYTPDGEVDIAALVQQSLVAATDAIISLVDRRWDNGCQFGHLFFTGGGSELLRQALLQQYPKGVVLPDPVTANAVGLARYAQRSGVFPAQLSESTGNHRKIPAL